MVSNNKTNNTKSKPKTNFSAQHECGTAYALSPRCIVESLADMEFRNNPDSSVGNKLAVMADTLSDDDSVVLNVYGIQTTVHTSPVGRWSFITKTTSKDSVVGYECRFSVSQSLLDVAYEKFQKTLGSIKTKQSKAILNDIAEMTESEIKAHIKSALLSKYKLKLTGIVSDLRKVVPQSIVLTYYIGFEESKRAGLEFRSHILTEQGTINEAFARFARISVAFNQLPTAPKTATAKKKKKTPAKPKQEVLPAEPVAESA